MMPDVEIPQLVSLATILVGILIMALAPRPLKVRARHALVLAIAAWALTRTVHEMRVSAWQSEIRTISVLCGALAMARLSFLLAVEIVLERGGRVPVNQLRRDVTQFLIYVSAAAIALRSQRISVTSLITTGTVITAIIGLGLQETLGNFAAGAAIQIERPIDVGDWVQLDKGDATGRVIATTWRSVVLQTDDRALFVIPNSVFSKTAFYNRSRPGGATRRSLYFTLPFDVAPTQVHEAILAACADAPDVLKEPRPTVLTWNFGESGIQYWLRFFIADFARRDLSHGDVATRVWFQLHRRKLATAVPLLHAVVEQPDVVSRTKEAAMVVADRRAAIDAVDFLKPLSEAAKDSLARRGHRRLFAPGETVIRQGETERDFYVVRRGRVEIRVDDRKLTQLGPGEFFGEMAMLTGSARHAAAMAASRTAAPTRASTRRQKEANSEQATLRDRDRALRERMPGDASAGPCARRRRER